MVIAPVDTTSQPAIRHCPAQTRRSDRRGWADAATSVDSRRRHRSSWSCATARRPGRAIGSRAMRECWRERSVPVGSTDRCHHRHRPASATEMKEAANW